MNLNPYKAFSAPERVRSSFARCLLKSLAANAESIPFCSAPTPPFEFTVEDDAGNAFDTWLRLHENFLNSVFNS
uniref:Uncharacterized protein n=1 Tax=Cucumis sativus TaxID=3659 RepID=A0A0A0KY89_CUCSA